MESTFEKRMLEIASDILLAVSRGELAPTSAVVGAAAHAIARLRPEAPGAHAVTGGARPEDADVGSGLAIGQVSGAPDPAAEPRTPARVSAADVAEPRGGARAPRLVAPIEHVLSVASLMRASRLPFAAACARRAGESGVSAQAVRNACCRWLDLSAHDWQPLWVAGSEEAARAVAQRVVDRNGWARERIAAAFGVQAAALDGAARSAR